MEGKVQKTTFSGLEGALRGNQEAAEMKMQSFSLAVTRMEGIRDKDIRSTAHVRCFGDKEASLVTLK